MSEPELARTVHHRGRVYTKGMTAKQIGARAAEIGAHAWVGGKAPSQRQVPKTDDPTSGTPAGQPPVPTMSALPGGPPDSVPPTPVEAGEDPPPPPPKPAAVKRAAVKKATQIPAS